MKKTCLENWILRSVTKFKCTVNMSQLADKYCLILYDWILFLGLKSKNKQYFHVGSLEHFGNKTLFCMDNAMIE